MASVRVSQGGVTARLSGLDAERVRAIVERMAGEAVRPLLAEAERVAADARAEWYGPRGVERETGQSGDIEATLTVDMGRDVVRVGVGSTDPRNVKGKPTVVYVHSPGMASTSWVEVSAAQYWATPEPLRGPFSRVGASKRVLQALGKLNPPVIRQPTPGAGSGHGVLLQALVKKPYRAAVKQLIPRIGDAIARGWGARG